MMMSFSSWEERAETHQSSRCYTGLVSSCRYLELKPHNSKNIVKPASKNADDVEEKMKDKKTELVVNGRLIGAVKRFRTNRRASELINEQFEGEYRTYPESRKRGRSRIY